MELGLNLFNDIDTIGRIYLEGFVLCFSAHIFASSSVSVSTAFLEKERFRSFSRKASFSAYHSVVWRIQLLGDISRARFFWWDETGL